MQVHTMKLQNCSLDYHHIVFVLWKQNVQAKEVYSTFINIGMMKHNYFSKK